LGSVHYQSAANTTATLAPGTAGYVLTTNGAGFAPTWGPISGAAVGNLSGGVWGSVPYQSGPGTTAMLPPGPTAGYVLSTNGPGQTPSWVSGFTLPDQTGMSGRILQTNGSVSVWATPTYSSTNFLSGLTGDVAITTPLTGQMLQYDGIHWINLNLLNSNAATSGTNIDLSAVSLPALYNVYPLSSTSAVTVTLPIPSSLNKGRILLLKPSTYSANNTNITVKGYIEGNSGTIQTLDLGNSNGSNSFPAQLLSDGSSWWVISGR
jgi:hypothetical protein